MEVLTENEIQILEEAEYDYCFVLVVELEEPTIIPVSGNVEETYISAF